jgi:hypothetical protein
MTPALGSLLAASLAAAAIGLGALDIDGNRRRRLALSAALAATAVGVYVHTPASEIETKGGAQDAIAVAFCYASMVLGMAAQYCYRQAEGGAKRLRFRAAEFMMPIFASPIVFIPLLGIASEAAMSGPFTHARLMVYLVAFQNGFFWKNFFEERRQRPLAAAEAR